MYSFRPLFKKFLSGKIRKKKGFTLLEVLIALSLISSLLITLIYTVNHHLKLVDRQETITVATLLAKEKLRELSWSDKQRDTGAFEDPYHPYSFKYTQYPSQVPDMMIKELRVWKDKEEVILREVVYKDGGGGS